MKSTIADPWNPGMGWLDCRFRTPWWSSFAPNAGKESGCSQEYSGISVATAISLPLGDRLFEKTSDNHPLSALQRQNPRPGNDCYNRAGDSSPEDLHRLWASTDHTRKRTLKHAYTLYIGVIFKIRAIFPIFTCSTYIVT